MLPDELQRQRFAQELDRNFSVIAPAGVGKTSAIAERVTQVVRRALLGGPSARGLTVVTYTKKAAAEMQDRVRQRLAQEQPDGRAYEVLSQVFFGTLHSFCLELVRTHGWALGLPLEWRVVEDDEVLWQEFLDEQPDLFRCLPTATREAVYRLCSVETILALARHWPPSDLPDSPLPACPEPDLTPLLQYPAQGRGAAGIEFHQQQARRWLESWARPVEGDSPLPLLGRLRVHKGSKDFLALAQGCLQPLYAWERQAVAQVARALAVEHAAFRQRRGVATFDDAVRLAAGLFEVPSVARQIRSADLRIILDEAQDTDPLQFQVLVEAGRPPEATGLWLREGGLPPRPGAFCQVGDPQQSIYSERADLSLYRQVHAALTAPGVGEALTFSVTFRCQRVLVEAFNQALPQVLVEEGRGREGQVAYEPLQAAPGAAEGQIVRLVLPKPAGLEIKGTAWEPTYAQLLVEQLQGLGLAELRARSLAQVALLCPRNQWRQALQEAIRQVGLPLQAEPGQRLRQEHPAHAWTTALCAVLADPGDAFELAGVLREVYGLPDEALARWVREQRKPSRRQGWHPLNLLQAPDPQDHSLVAAALRQLWELRERVTHLPLGAALPQIFGEVRLQARLEALGTHTPAALANILDRYCEDALRAEQEGQTFSAWVDTLRSALDGPLETEETPREAWQSLSCHKAKGLGFDAVIVPFFFRKISFPNQKTPCALAHTESGRHEAFLANEDIPEERKAQMQARRVRENERLLYVTLTRARQTLILVDDQEWFPKHENSFGRLLKVSPDQSNHAWWNSLPLSPRADPQLQPAPAITVTERPEALPPVVPALAPLRLEALPRRVIPSSLARHADEYPAPVTVAPESPELPSPTAYGNWWHGLMERAPWGQAISAWADYAAAAWGDCPDPERGRREWGSFLGSRLFRDLQRPGWQVRTECPFLWSGDALTLYEGFIDWLAVHPQAGEAWVVDWKTDRLESPDPAGELRERYAPQVDVYRRALADLLGLPTRAWLYSTVGAFAVEVTGPEA